MKTMNYKKIIITISLLMTIFSVSALSIQSYVDVTKVGINDTFTLTIEISGKNASKVDEVKLPNKLDFDVIGQTSSSSSSITIVNGKMERKTTKSFIYTLQPQKIGTFIIAPISLTFKGKTITTSPIKMVVTKNSGNRPSHQNRQQQNQFFADPFTSNQPRQNISKNNTFVIAKLNKNTVFEGEPVIVSYYLLTKDRLLNLSFGKSPDYKGFWKENLYTADKVSFQRTNYKGQIYKQMLLTKIALSANNSGKLFIPSLEMNVQVSVPARSFFDFDSSRQITVRSKKIPLTVLPLPTKNQPVSFTGAIGQFTLEDSLNVSGLKVGDSFTYTLKIKGKGNFNQFVAPQLKKMVHFHFLDPETKTGFFDKTNMSGIKRIKYLVIAEEVGNYQIPKIEFSFFNPQIKKYITLSTKPHNLEIKAGKKSFIPNGFVQSNVSSEGADIGFIYTTISKKPKQLLFDKFVYWLIYLFSILSLIGAYYYSKEKNKLLNNTEYRRIKNASKILKKYLKEAEEYSKNGDKKFYSSSQVGISNYITDKLNISRGSTTSEIYDKIKSGKFANILDDIKEYFEICDRARFTPEEISKEKIQSDEEKLRSLISKIQQI